MFKALTSQTSKLPFHSVLFCSSVETMLSGAATSQKSPPPLSYTPLQWCVCSNLHSNWPQHRRWPFANTWRKKKQLCFYPEGRIWTMLPDTKLTCTERVCWQGGSDSPTSISVCLIYSSLVNQKLDGSSWKLNHIFLFFKPSCLCGTVPHWSKSVSLAHWAALLHSTA